MSIASPTKPLTVALIGNPNTGKSTLFSALAGVRQRVGNYPGVTVEKKLGQAEFHGRAFTFVDLPGTYSLAPRSPDEMVAVDVLLGRRDDVPPIDIVLCVVDASNLERNFYLVSQVLELGLPTVVALNMIDVAQDKGLILDLDRLSKQLPVAFVRLQANRGIGVADLKQALAAAEDASLQDLRRTASPFPPAFTAEIKALAAKINADGRPAVPHYLVERIVLDTSGYLFQAGMPGIDDRLLDDVQAARGRLAAAGLRVPAVEAVARYSWAAHVLDGVITRPAARRVTTSDRIDQLLTHRVSGTLIFLAVMLLIFQAVFLVAEPASAVIDSLIAAIGSWIEPLIPAGAMRSLVITGVLGGVGGVLKFLPQILALFFFIAVLEDCGYMARAAYLMDKLMSRIGLSGKSFIPLLSSFACAVPAIMATRVIESRRDRMVTILIAPLMSCSARLPVYALMIGAFVPNLTIGRGWFAIPWLHGLVMFAMYSIGLVTGIAAAWVLKRTLFRGPTPPFVMELPSYKVPGLSVVVQRMWEQGCSFITNAGTLILAVSIVIWGLGYFPHDHSQIDPSLSDENQIAAAYLETSYLGRMGHAIEPAVRPLGWDWRIGCAAIASFPAREVVVGALGVIYNLGEGADENSPALRETLRRATWPNTDKPVFNTPVALSIMVFFALCAQCSSTLVVMRRETGSWRWPVLAFVYMTTLAYIGALITYQVGIRLAG